MRGLLIAALLLTATAAVAQLMTLGIGNNSGGSGPPPICTADGKTDFTNPCDIPLGKALGIM